MSMISEQIQTIRAIAQEFDSNDKKVAVDRICKKILMDAADTIEILSEKLAAANMERSSAYYGSGWIPCSERMPKENQIVLVFTEKGGIDTDFYGRHCNGFVKLKGRPEKAVAWIPLPEPYNGE